MLNILKHVASELAMHPLAYACTDFWLLLIAGRSALAAADGVLTSIKAGTGENQSTSQPTNQPTKYSFNQSFNQTFNQSIIQSVIQCLPASRLGCSKPTGSIMEGPPASAALARDLHMCHCVVSLGGVTVWCHCVG